MLFKICPRCGSKKVKWIIPQNWSTWECYDCDYTGPIIEGNEELSEEIREAYLESQKHPQENTDEDDLITQLIDTSKKLCEETLRQNTYSEVLRMAILYGVAYLYEHRETANYKELKQMLYHLLLADRKDIF